MRGFVLVLMSLLFLACTTFSPSPPQQASMPNTTQVVVPPQVNITPQVIIQTSQGEIPITIEIARTVEERRKGLMHRLEPEEDHGMLFVFDTEQTLHFWMKNTLIPLDILFIDKDWKIVDIQTMAPCREENCLTYESKKAARYALEVSAGLAEKHRILVGDSVRKI